MTTQRVRALAAGIVLALAVGTSWGAGAASPAEARPPLDINGSFIQPWVIDGMTDQQLFDEVGYLSRAGMSQQIFFNTADSGRKTTVFPSGIPGYTQETSTDTLGRMLTAADEAYRTMGACVTEYVGLQLTDEWWTKHADDEAWLNREADFAKTLAHSIWDRYGSHPSFGGWYIAFEVDNANFTTEASWAALARFYTKVAGHLREITPRLPIIISPFYNTHWGMDSAGWARMWEYVLGHSSIDVIAPQDGFGAGSATTAQIAEWFAATKTAIQRSGARTDLWDNVETYADPCDPHPLDIATVVANINAARPYVTNYLSFSYDHYDSPVLVNPAYDQTYRNYRINRVVETEPPSSPSGLAAKIIHSQEVSLEWNKSTDNIGVVGYRVFRNGVLIHTVYSTTASFTDTTLPHMQKATYSVAAIDAAGNVSGQSGAVTVTMPYTLADVASYKTSLPADNLYPDAGKELTNRVLGAPVYTDSAWQGRSTSGSYSFTVDLGSEKIVKEVHSDWLQMRGPYIYLPARLTVETAPNNGNFTPAGTITSPVVGQCDQSVEYRLAGLNVNARYVRITVTPPNYVWTFTDELEVVT